MKSPGGPSLSGVAVCAVLLLLPVLVAGCDPKRSSPAAPAATTQPLVLAPKDDPDAELRQCEEARIEGLRDEFRALPKADQVFVAMMNNKLRRRPAERLTEPEAEGLRRLGTYISEVTRRDYRVRSRMPPGPIGWSFC